MTQMNPSTKQISQVMLVVKRPPANCRRYSCSLGKSYYIDLSAAFREFPHIL